MKSTVNFASLNEHQVTTLHYKGLPNLPVWDKNTNTIQGQKKYPGEEGISGGVLLESSTCVRK
jgi:hypothetical protein